ncbi:MAG: hypothetical protein AAGJ82_06600, partial [Bacteroidota bacterium]
LTTNTYYDAGIFTVEYFWLNGSYGRYGLCIDDDRQDNVTTDNNGNSRIKLPNMNVCWQGNGIWFDFCTQCNDCNNSATSPQGRWWKYNELFDSGDLAPFTSVSSPFPVDLQFMMTVGCSFETNYGCGADESQ